MKIQFQSSVRMITLFNYNINGLLQISCIHKKDKEYLFSINVIVFFFFTVGVRVSVTRKERSFFNKYLVKNNKFE